MENQNLTNQSEKKPQMAEADRLIQVLIRDFSQHIEKETEPFVILLKGHLLLEYYLNQVILLSTTGVKNVERKGFYEKVFLVETTDKNIFKTKTFNSLKKLNELRNRLSHTLNFKITPSEIDPVGFCFEKEYVLKKYNNPDDEAFLLKWVLMKIAQDVFYSIYAEISKSKGLTPLSRG